MISYHGGEHLVSFERYAQILSQNFNVRIYLDGVRAETHEDNSIHLPNIKNMTSQELDVLFGILLHEIGHVRFSKLTNDEMKKMKGRDHFSIWNGIEDARIENKLMARFDGANNIFEDLYGTHFVKLAKKIFGIDFADDTDQWHLFCVHVHDYLVKTRRKFYNIDNYSETVKSSVLELFAKAKPIIDAHKLSRAEHAFSLSAKLFKKFAPKRPEFLNEFKNVVTDLDKCKKELQDVYNSFKNNEELKQLKAQKKELEAKKKKAKKASEKNDDFKIYQEAADVLDKVSAMIDYHEFLENIKTLTDDIAKLKTQLNELETRLAKENVELAKFQDLLAEMKKDKSATEEQLAQNKEEIKKRKKHIKEIEKQIKAIKRTVATKEKQLKTKNRNADYFNDLKKNNPYASMSMEELDKKHQEALERYSKFHDSANSALKEIYDLRNEIEKLKNQIKTINSENKNKFKEALRNIEKKLGKNGFENFDSLPHFEKNEDWLESDDVQQEFDKQATDNGDKIVNNGMSKISGERSILMTIDKIGNDLEEIDLAKVFKERLGMDELKNYNDYLSEIRNTSEESDADINLVNKQYFPATTQFDISRAELGPSNLNILTDIRSKNASVINELASIFKIKMRNVKHIRFKGNQEEGIIDARSVYKIPNNIYDHIFERAFVKPNDRVVVTVAVDISGSMDKDVTAGGKRLKELAVILDAALTKAMIKHEVVGYGAPADRDVAALNANGALYTRTQHRLETVTYRTFTGANGLGNLDVKCWDNVNSESLRNIAYRLMRLRSKIKVIINISDGKSFLHGTDVGILDNDLVKTIDWMASNKVQLYHLGFNNYGERFYKENHCTIKDNYLNLAEFFRKSK